jgi:hypothetical protein
MAAMEPPIFQSPVIIQTIRKVTKEAVIRQVRVFAIDLFFCSSIYLQIQQKGEIIAEVNPDYKISMLINPRIYFQ